MTKPIRNGIIHHPGRLFRQLAVLLLALLLTACGAREPEARFLEFRTALEGSGPVSVTAEVAAELPERGTMTFTLTCTEEADGFSVTVKEPELLSGISARLRQDQDTLVYDDIVLPLAEPDGNGLSPLTALPLLLTAVRSGHAALFWTEQDALAAQLLPNDDVEVRLYLDGTDTPAYAELSADGAASVTCRIIRWETNERGYNNEPKDQNMGGNQPVQSGA